VIGSAPLSVTSAFLGCCCCKQDHSPMITACIEVQNFSKIWMGFGRVHYYLIFQTC
jgi:hypothetical protein